VSTYISKKKPLVKLIYVTKFITHQILERSHFLIVDFFLCCLRRICKLQPVVDVCTWDVKRYVMPMPGAAGPYICGSNDGSLPSGDVKICGSIDPYSTRAFPVSKMQNPDQNCDEVWCSASSNTSFIGSSVVQWLALDLRW
jgi:hypothetical protein